MPDSVHFSFDQNTLNKLWTRLGAAGAVSTLVPPMTRSAARLRQRLATYPAQVHRPNPPKTPAQRAFLAIMAKNGLLPYRRTGNLGRSWVDEVTTTPHSVTATLGNAVVSPTGKRYGPLVQGTSEQAWMHQGVWQTFEQVAEDERVNIENDLMGAINSALG